MPKTRGRVLGTKREPEREAHLISMAESWLRIAINAEQIQALTDRARPLFSEIKTWTLANLVQNGHGSALAQLRPVTRERGRMHSFGGGSS